VRSADGEKLENASTKTVNLGIGIAKSLEKSIEDTSKSIGKKYDEVNTKAKSANDFGSLKYAKVAAHSGILQMLYIAPFTLFFTLKRA